MSDPMQTDTLDTCSACEASAPLPVIYNRPGLPTLSYRLRTHGTAFAAMLASLSSSFLDVPLGEVDEQGNPDPLQGLTTRAPDDPSIALLDAWATVVDVLTFYQERIANEGFLRTATERGSVLELARAIGYELNPGVAAETFLAFTVESAPGAPTRAMVDIGTKVLSVPGQNEKPQTFETVEKMEARAEWNALKPQLNKKQSLSLDCDEVYLEGIAPNLKPGDGLLIIGPEHETDQDFRHWAFHRVQTVTIDPSRQSTKVTWERRPDYNELGSSIELSEMDQGVYAFRQRASLFGHNAPDWLTPYLPDGLVAEYFEGADLVPGKRKVVRIEGQVDFDWDANPDPVIGATDFSARWTGYLKPPSTGWYTFWTVSDDGVRLWIDDKNIIDKWTVHAARLDYGSIQLEGGQMYAVKLEYFQAKGAAKIRLSWSPPGETTESVIRGVYLSPYLPKGNYIEWQGFTISSVSDKNSIIHLDGTLPHVIPRSWLVLSTPDDHEVFRATEVIEDARTRFTLSGKTTRVTLQGDKLKKFDNCIRETVVFAQSEKLEMAEMPLTDPIYGKQIDLGDARLDLMPGQALVVSGKRIYVKFEVTADVKATTADGTQSVTLEAGEVLQVVSPPLTANGNPLDDLCHVLDNKSPQSLTWPLLGRGGSLVSVTAPSNQTSLQPASKDDPLISEIAFIDKVEDNDATITLRDSLQNVYDRQSVTINANVARATHGETVAKEILGSGDASSANRSFVLKRPPLTYVSAATASGAQSTLTIRVNGVEWKQVPSLYGLDARSQSYIVRIDNDGKASVIFGDGKSGAQPASGAENVTATYRTGIGPDGNVAEGKLTLLQTRPFGIRGVSNPKPASGGVAPEVLEDARRNAPVTVLTLDRIVSLRDFEDFVRSFAGIGKAQAVRLWNGHTHFVYVTVATTDGKPIDTKSNLYANLRAGIDAARDPVQPIDVKGHAPRSFRLSAGVFIDQRYVHEEVIAQAKRALLEAFAFEKRNFGQPVTAAEVMTIIQAVPGVIAVDLDELSLDSAPMDTSGKVPPFLTAKQASFDPKLGQIQAELLLINPRGITLTKKETS